MGSRRRLERSASSTADYRKKIDDAAVVLLEGSRTKPVVLTHARPEDLSGAMRDIRAAYYAAVKSGMQDPVVFVIHRMSDYARRNGLDATAEPFTFRAVTEAQALELGLITKPLTSPGRAPLKPPAFNVLLATAGRVEDFCVYNREANDFADMIWSNPGCRAALEAETPGLAEQLRLHPEWLEDPSTCNI